MSARAGIVVTGTEVLTGRTSDRNSPYLSDRLRELGVDLAYVQIVADRREDMAAALAFMAAQQLDLVITSGGLGPTADDITAEVVGRFQGREMVLDEALERRIAEIVEPLRKRWPNLDLAAIEAGTRKQATIPRGARVLEPVGTAPGLVVTPAERDGVPIDAPTIVVLPGPPRELQPMWAQAVATEQLQRAIAAATTYRQQTLRLFGMPESEIAETLRVAERDGVPLEQLEITTCLKRGEIEVVTRYEPDAEGAYQDFAEIVAERHADTLFSSDGRTVDEIVAGLLLERRLSDRDGRVVHRRPARGTADRAPRRLGLRQGRSGRLRKRGEDRPGRRHARDARAPRRRLRRGRRGARARRSRAPRRRPRRRHHRHRRTGRRHRAEARRARLAVRRRAGRAGADDPLGQPARRPCRRARPLEHRRDAHAAARAAALIARSPSRTLLSWHR